MGIWFSIFTVAHPTQAPGAPRLRGQGQLGWAVHSGEGHPCTHQGTSSLCALRPACLCKFHLRPTFRQERKNIHQVDHTRGGRGTQLRDMCHLQGTAGDWCPRNLSLKMQLDTCPKEQVRLC